MKKQYFVEIFLPKSAGMKEREIFSQLLVRLAAKFSFTGMEDWQIELTSKEKVLGAEQEFHDLTKKKKANEKICMYFSVQKDAQKFSQILVSAFSDLRLSKVKQLAPKDWMKEWRKHYKTQVIAKGKTKIAIVPAWKKSPARIPSVRIYPGQAFGTGTHPTTRLCLRAFLQYGEELPLKARILDFGAGTGILAVAAKKTLPTSTVLAVESDPVALEQGRKNVKLNRTKIQLRRTIKQGVKGPVKYHWVFANVLAPVLLEFKDLLKNSLAPGGFLVLSGVLYKDHKQFLKEFLRADSALHLESVEREGDWAAMVVRCA